MATKHITSSSLSRISSVPLPPFPLDIKMPASTTFQRSLLNMCEEAACHGTTLEQIRLRLLRDKFTSFTFPPLFVSVAGAFMKCKSIYSGLYKARLNKDIDIASLSNGEWSNSQCTSAQRLATTSQVSLLWRTPWIYPNFGRSYASAAESRKREMGVLDDAEDDDHGNGHESSDYEADSNVEDEQRIEDSDEEAEDEDQQPQSQEPAKKKFQTQVHKSKPSDQQGRLLNEKISARTIRLVNDDTKDHVIVSRDEALTRAKEKRMDLVLVDGKANPPVCKIYDFNKEEYKQEQVLKDRKKQKGATAHLNEVKELRFNSKTEPKDLKMKVEQAKAFMDRGYRVKFVAMFKGKLDDEIKRLEEEKMIDAILPMIEDVAAIEQGPRVESRQAWVMLKHLKFSKKKPPKREAKIGAKEQVEEVKQEDYTYSEPDFDEGQEESNMHAQNASSVSEAAAAMERLQGYPSKLTSPSTKPFTFQSSRPQLQPPPVQDMVDLFTPQISSPPLHGFSEDTQPLQGFGGSQGSERVISPPPDLRQSMPSLQRAGVQGVKIPNLQPQPSVSSLPTSSLRSEGTLIHKPQTSLLDGMLPPQNEQHPSHTPRIQRLSMPSQSPGKISEKQSSSNAPYPVKAIGSEAAQGEYPAAPRGRGIPPPNQPAHSLFSRTTPAPLQGSPSNLQGPLLNFSQPPQMPSGMPRHGPEDLHGPFSNASPSLQETSLHPGVPSNLKSPLSDFLPSQPPSTFQHAPSSSQSSQSYSLPFVPSQNLQKKDSLPSHRSEGIPPGGVPRYPPSPLQGVPPRGGPPRYPPPPIGHPSYAPPLGQPNFQSSQMAQGQFAPNTQTQQLQGSDSMHQVRPQTRPALNAAAAQQFPPLQNSKPEQGQGRYAPAPNLFRSSQRPPQGPSNPFGSPQPSQQGPPNPFGASDHSHQGPPNLFGSPGHSQQGSSNFFRPPQQPQQGPPTFFGSAQRPQQGPPHFVGSPQPPQQGPPYFGGSSQRPQQGPPSFIGSAPLPQQAPPNFYGIPPRPPQQAPPNFFGSQPYIQQRPPEPSQIQFSQQPASVPKGSRQGGPWLSQQGPPGHPSPMPSHPQQTRQPPSQGHQGYFSQQEAEGGPWLSHQAPTQHHSPMPTHPQQTGQAPSSVHQGYFAQQEAEGGGQKHWQSQAMQGYPPQQVQAPQSYPPPQRGFPQTRGPFGFQENHTQNQAFQQPPPPRGFPQTRPVVPSSGFRPTWSNSPESQEYSPLFEVPPDKS